jgi:hydrogenase nickel incorporation protein HypB
MCTTCGCGETHVHHHHDHDHHHAHGEDQGHHHHYGLGEAGVHVAGFSQERLVQIERDVLGKNDVHARRNRAYFEQHGILALNLVSGPGSGKTTLLERSLKDLRGEFELAVIEGDQQTAHDAERIRATGVKAIQINTGKGCHLDAHQVGHALDDLDIQDNSLLFIENVGNLVCPAMFDLGEAGKVVMLSVTEGEDKPVKYPDMFHRAAVVLLNKMDLLPHVPFDLDRCLDYLRQVNREAPILRVSASTGEGMDSWYGWLRERRETLLAARAAKLESELTALKNQLRPLKP